MRRAIRQEAHRTEISAAVPKYRQAALLSGPFKNPAAAKKSFSKGEFALHSCEFLNRQAVCL